MKFDIKSYYFVAILLISSAIIPAQNIFTFAGGNLGFYGDGGPAVAAGLSSPTGIASDKNGNIYFSDSGNNRIRMINSVGTITTIVGSFSSGFSGDGGLAISAQINGPFDMEIDRKGNVFFIDGGNNRVRKIDTNGLITTVAGDGSNTYSSDGVLATTTGLKKPMGIAVDKIGNLYISDMFYSSIRKVDTTGKIWTVAGTGNHGYNGDGILAINADINFPQGLSTDTLGNLYIVDKNNSRLRKVDNSGIITTVAGMGVGGYSGDGGAATLAKITPLDVFAESDGGLFIAEGFSYIRQVNSLGIISTYSGIGTQGNSGDGGLATLAQFFLPSNITKDNKGNLYVSDNGDARIRVICPSNCFASLGDLKKDNEKINVFPNPVSNVLNISNELLKLENSETEISNCLAQVIMKTPFSNSIDVSSLAQGCYTLKIISSSRNYYSKFIKE